MSIEGVYMIYWPDIMRTFENGLIQGLIPRVTLLNCTQLRSTIPITRTETNVSVIYYVFVYISCIDEWCTFISGL